MHDAMAGASSGRRTEPEMLRSYHQNARCAVACNEMSVVCNGTLLSSFITVTRLRIDASSHGETANGAAASAKSELVTYAYYVKNFQVLSTRHLPWAGFGSIWPHGLRLLSDVQKVKIVTPLRNANTHK